MSMESPNFDPHLFLLLHSIFRNASADPQILDYVAQLPPKELNKYRDTVLIFHDFWSEFIHASVGPIKDLDPKVNQVGKSVGLFIDYNDATSDSRFKMPEISHTKKDWWGVLHDKPRSDAPRG